MGSIFFLIGPMPILSVSCNYPFRMCLYICPLQMYFLAIRSYDQFKASHWSTLLPYLLFFFFFVTSPFGGGGKKEYGYYYPHHSRNFLSPVCRIFFLIKNYLINNTNYYVEPKISQAKHLAMKNNTLQKFILSWKIKKY